jgi:hypothetical protein
MLQNYGHLALLESVVIVKDFMQPKLWPHFASSQFARQLFKGILRMLLYYGEGKQTT